MNKVTFQGLVNQLPSLPYEQKRDLIQLLTSMINEDGLSIIESHCDQLACCYCGTTHVIKWGKSGDLQRYKCHESSCGKTFNALTGTPLANLRSKEKWLSYLSCMIDGLTLRKCAARLNINLTTAFRWRHRFLKLPTDNLPKEVSGIVEADETFFLESFKGNHTINNRPAHKRGGEGKKNRKEDKISVLIVRDRQGNVCDYVLDNLSKAEIQQHLKTIVSPDSILCSDGASWYKTFAKEEGIAHHRLITLDNRRVIGKEYHIQNVNGYISRLKNWMTRFNGVGTAYLKNYLGWRRIFESKEHLGTEAEWLKLALGYS
jgi:transposase-like protein